GHREDLSVRAGDDGATPLGVQFLDVFGQGTGRVPLQVAVQGQAHVTAGFGLAHQSPGHGDLCAVAAHLDLALACLPGQGAVEVTLQSFQAVPLGSDEADQVSGPGVLGVDAFVVDLRTDPAQPQVAKFLPVLVGDLLGHHLVAAGCGVDLCGHLPLVKVETCG